MPTVPTLPSLNNPVQNTIVQGRFGAQASVEAFGGGQVLAQPEASIDRGFGLASKIVVEEQKKADDLVTTDLYSKAARLKQQLTYGDGGLLSLQGKDAFGASEKINQKWQDGIKELQSQTSNSEQQRLFSGLSTRLTGDLNDDIEKHTYVERKKFDDETTRGGVDAARDEAVLNATDHNKVAAQYDLVKSILNQKAQREGVSVDSPAYQELTRKEFSQFHTGVASRLMDLNQDVAAKNYFEANKSDMTAEQIIAVGKAVDEASTLGTSQRYRDKIVTTNSDETAALAEAYKIRSPKTQEKTVELVKQYFSNQNAAAAQADKKLIANVINTIDETGSYDSLSADIKMRLTPENKVFAQNYAKRKNENIPENSELVYNLRLMAADPATRQQYATLDLYKTAKGKIPDSEFTELQKTQVGIIEKDGVTNGLLNYRNQNQQIITDTLSKIGGSAFLGFGSGPASATVQANNLIQQEISQQEKVLKRQLTGPETQDIANRYATSFVTSPSKFSFLGFSPFQSSKPIGSLTPQDIKIENIPEVDKQKVARELSNKGWPITNENVVQFYLKALQVGALKPNAQ